MIIKNAWKFIQRAKGRNILIGIIIFTVATTSTIALSIMKAANDAKEQGLANTKITAQIVQNRQKIMEQAQTNNSGGPRMFDRASMPTLTLDQLKQYSQLGGVEDFYYTNSAYLSNANNFSPIKTSDNSNSSNSRNNSIMGLENSADFSIKGYSSQAAMSDFINGTNQISEGTVFQFTETNSTETNNSEIECDISSTLAAQNNAKISDIITLKNPLKESETYKFKIVGIYKSTSENTQANSMFSATSQDPSNNILVSESSVENIIANSEKSPASSTSEGPDGQARQISSKMEDQISGTFVLPTKSAYDEFSNNLKTVGLSDSFILQSQDIENFEQSILPLEQLANFALILLIIILSVGTVVLIVLNLFNIRERKYEIGVFSAIGMRKKKVAIQFICELLIVTIMAITLGAFAGSVASVPVSNSMLASQIQQVESKTSTQTRTFGPNAAGGGGAGGPGQENGSSQNSGMPGGGMSSGGFSRGPLNNRTENANANPIQYISQINTTLDINILLELLGLGLILSILASAGQMIFVLRYEPLQILVDRN
ncbi:MAG: ABC transporter permease [Bifidobacteriaceae bacterium]|jgi:putative ABC transport system permease protein|nr:ABC transporter permease [Bifidobacteriaceae bacterium]